LILFGGWNVNFLKNNTELLHLLDVLERNNLINVVETPTTPCINSKSLIAVMIVDKLLKQRLLLNVDLGYSDHLAQILYIKVNTSFNILKYTRRRSFMENNMQEFTFLLQKES
jgi:hypothetical protein